MLRHFAVLLGAVLAAGLPLLEFGDVVLKDVGHRSDFEDVRAAICGTLSGA